MSKTAKKNKKSETPKKAPRETVKVRLFSKPTLYSTYGFPECKHEDITIVRNKVTDNIDYCTSMWHLALDRECVEQIHHIFKSLKPTANSTHIIGQCDKLLEDHGIVPE